MNKLVFNCLHHLLLFAFFLYLFLYLCCSHPPLIKQPVQQPSRCHLGFHCSTAPRKITILGKENISNLLNLDKRASHCHTIAIPLLQHHMMAVLHNIASYNLYTHQKVIPQNLLNCSKFCSAILSTVGVAKIFSKARLTFKLFVDKLSGCQPLYSAYLLFVFFCTPFAFFNPVKSTQKHVNLQQKLLL